MSGSTTVQRPKQSSKQPLDELIPGKTICMTGRVPLNAGSEVLPPELLEKCENTVIESCGLCQTCYRGVLRMIGAGEVTRDQAEEIGAILPPARPPAQSNIERALRTAKAAKRRTK